MDAVAANLAQSHNAIAVQHAVAAIRVQTLAAVTEEQYMDKQKCALAILAIVQVLAIAATSLIAHAEQMQQIMKHVNAVVDANPDVLPVFL